MSSTANRVIKNTGYLYAKMSITMFISLYTTRLILNSIGACDFGIFNIVGGAIAMLGFLNAAMASATQRFMSYSVGEGNKEKQKSIFNTSFILHFILSLIVSIALLIGGYFFFNGILNIPAERVFAAKVVYGSLIISTMFTVMTVPYDAVMNAHENMKYYAIIGIIESLLKLLVAFVCVYTSFDKLITYGILMAGIPLTTLTIMRIYCHKHYDECIISPRTYWNKPLMKEMTSFAGWGFFSTMAIMVSNYGLGIVANIFYGVILNTALGIAQQIDGQLKVFSNNMLKALNPVIVKKEGSGNTHKMLDITMTGSKFSFLMFSFFVVPFFIEAPVILKLWLKEVPEHCILFCRLQLLASLFGQLGATMNSAIYADGHIKTFSFYSSILYICSIILTYLFFKIGMPPYFMYTSVILLNVIAYRILGLVILHRNCHLHYSDYGKKVLLPCISFCLILFILTLGSTSIIHSGIPRLFITFIINSISFIVCFFTIGIDNKERSIIFSILKRNKK
jgi:O-antigen/teichoic acid export membrane protein